jgi:hypothetical protein
MAVSLRGYGGARRQAQRERDTTAGFVHLHCLNPPLDLSLRMGQDLPQITGGYGGWETTQRPRAVGMTTWSGVPPFELSLNLMLGKKDLSDSGSQEQKIRQLTDVARGTRDHVPGIVYIDGIAGLPADKWVINNIDFGDAIRRREDMHRIRQMVTITFLEWQPPEYETLRKGALAKARPKTVVYTVKKGDTPAKIAKHRRGDWKDIREVNRKGVIKKANQQPRKGTPFHVGARINVTVKDKPQRNRRRGRGRARRQTGRD